MCKDYGISSLCTHSLEFAQRLKRTLRFVQSSVQLPPLWYPFLENNNYLGGPEFQSLFVLLKEIVVLCLALLLKLESDLQQKARMNVDHILYIIFFPSMIIALSSLYSNFVQFQSYLQQNCDSDGHYESQN